MMNFVLVFLIVIRWNLVQLINIRILVLQILITERYTQSSNSLLILETDVLNF